MYKIGNLEGVSVSERTDLVAEPVREAIASLGLIGVLVAEIDPTLADTAAFCQHYDFPMEKSANCIILEANRGDRTWLAACVILATTRADVNGLARRTLDARRASFASQEKAVAETKMEYGGITPIGLPNDMPILVDAAVVESDYVVVGSGIRGSKLLIPGDTFRKFPNVVILEGLGRSAG